MSLRTTFLDELNALAKKGDARLRAKMREVMVDRHPATLDPDEQDPVATVALAWKEVAPRGRPAFEACAQKAVADLEQARLLDSPAAYDLPFAHAVLRLLRMLPDDLVNSQAKGRCVRLLSGMIAEREEFLERVNGTFSDAAALWTDAFRLYLAWHSRQPGWLETLWLTALTNEEWPLNEAASVFLEDAARSHSSFVTMDRLKEFWKGAVRRGASVQDLKRWLYVVGASLEDTPIGSERLGGLFQHFGGHLQDFRLSEQGIAWDHFVECMAAMFRNPAKQQQILEFKSPPHVPLSTRAHYRKISTDYKAPENTVTAELEASLMNSTSTP
jgi:hypothetical protein